MILAVPKIFQFAEHLDAILLSAEQLGNLGFDAIGTRSNICSVKCVISWYAHISTDNNINNK
jgi:hypothetical protein